MGRDLVSRVWEEIRALDRQPNQLDPLIGHWGPVKISVARRYPCREEGGCPGQGSKVAIRAVFPRDRLGGDEPYTRRRVQPDQRTGYLLNCRYLWPSRIDHWEGWCHGDAWPAEDGQWNEGSVVSISLQRQAGRPAQAYLELPSMPGLLVYC